MTDFLVKGATLKKKLSMAAAGTEVATESQTQTQTAMMLTTIPQMH
jgi:hypothetical protein